MGLQSLAYIFRRTWLSMDLHSGELVMNISFAILKENASIAQTHMMHDKGVSYL